MIVGIDHIAIAVNEGNKSSDLFSRLLNKPLTHQETVEKQQVNTFFHELGEEKTTVELLESTNENSTIHKFLEKRGQAMHHIAFLCENIEEEIERLKKEGFAFIDEKPQIGAGNKLIVFLHPKTTEGILIEICQKQ